MTIESLIDVLQKLPKNYEIAFSGVDNVPEREVSIVISHKEQFIILKYRSYLHEPKND